jgi:Fe-S-cluster-containing hydrogenase component 2
MLLDYLEENKNGQIIKIACGAGTQDPLYIENFVRIYAMAGVRFFDISAHQSSVDAARRGIEKANVKHDVYLNVSIGIPGDPHADKAKVVLSKCVNCRRCLQICPNEAIAHHPSSCSVIYARCVGCGKCQTVCPFDAITMYSEAKPAAEVIPALTGIDAVELHMEGDIKYGIGQWAELEKCYSGPLSVHINRRACGDKELLETLHTLIDHRAPWTTMIQADGMSMRGGDGVNTTLQAIAIMQIIEAEHFSAYTIASGGTNLYTPYYMREFDIPFGGVAYGTYARTLVRDFLCKEDPFMNQEAVRATMHRIFLAIEEIEEA